MSRGRRVRRDISENIATHPSIVYWQGGGKGGTRLQYMHACIVYVEHTHIHVRTHTHTERTADLKRTCAFECLCVCVCVLCLNALRIRGLLFKEERY